MSLKKPKQTSSFEITPNYVSATVRKSTILETIHQVEN